MIYNNIDEIPDYIWDYVEAWDTYEEEHQQHTTTATPIDQGTYAEFIRVYPK